jgi:hypothetical protein
MLILGIALEIARGIYLSGVPSRTLPADAAAAAYDASRPPATSDAL